MNAQAPKTTTPATIEQRIEGAIDRTVTNDLTVQDTGGGGTVAFSNMGQVLEFAKVMAISGIAVRPHFRGNPGACAAITMQAMRWNMDPFAVANKSYAVSDQIAYESQLIAAVVNTRAPLRNRLRSRYEGEGQNRRCTVSGTLLDEDEPREVKSPPLGQITPKNSPLWKNDPDQQLFYYTVRLWARRETPEILLGVYDREELAEARALANAKDVTPATPEALIEQAAHQGQTLSERAEAINAHDAAEDPQPEPDDQEHPYPEYKLDLLDDQGMVIKEGLSPGEWVTSYTDLLGRMKAKPEELEAFIKANSKAAVAITTEGLVVDGTAILAEAQQKARAKFAEPETAEEPQDDASGAGDAIETAEEPSPWYVECPDAPQRSAQCMKFVTGIKNKLDQCQSTEDFQGFLAANSDNIERINGLFSITDLKTALETAEANAA